jgi:hypothetical protein
MLDIYGGRITQHAARKHRDADGSVVPVRPPSRRSGNGSNPCAVCILGVVTVSDWNGQQCGSVCVELVDSD